MRSMLGKVALIVAYVVACCSADTPANCTYEDVRGTWIIYEGERSGTKDLDCTNFSGPVVEVQKLELLFPNLVADELGNKGYWTIVYNQGFEININYRNYFAFSKYQQHGPNVTSFCDAVLPGWSHDILGKNWACYTAKKTRALEPKVHFEKQLLQDHFYQTRTTLMKVINQYQDSWRATIYPELDGLPMEDIYRRSGGMKSQIHNIPSPAPVSKHHFKLAQQLPEQFDWRNISEINYVSPVRNQGSCGSCFAFASLAMLESRLRIATANKVQLVFSPQDVVSCSEYAQGCQGGFPYLIAGKYAQDFGVVPEECAPYVGKDDKCQEKHCKRYYVANFKYIGGFYGGCNEELMRLELVSNGPIAVAFEVYQDFQMYKGGIYHHTGLHAGFNPFLITNHAVLAVGYGIDEDTKEKYWIVKNSWGTTWGEDGYFRIRRGTDECAIESIAVAATPIP